MAVGRHSAPNGSEQQDSTNTGGATHSVSNVRLAGKRFKRTEGTVPEHGQQVEPPVMPYQRGPQDASQGPRKSHKPVIIAVCAVIAVLLVAYGIGVAFFSGHFYPNSTIGGLDVSTKDPQTVIAELEGHMDEYTLAVSGQGFEWDVTADEAGLDPDASTVVNSAIADNNPWSWPIQLFSEHVESGDLTGQFDEDVLKQSVEAKVSAFNKDRTAPTDATIKYDEEAGEFTVVPEKIGEQLDAGAVYEKISAAILALEDSLELDESVLLQPNRVADDERMTTALDEANGLLSTTITLTMGGEEVATVDASVLSGWITLDDDLHATVSTEAMKSWAAELGKKLDTVGTERTYERPDGKTVTVSGGTYGWVSDEAQLAEQLAAAIEAGESTTLEVPCVEKGVEFNGLGKQDWGAYVDIDLGEQHAYYYDASGKLLWDAGVITGNPNVGDDTPTGIYKLNNKQTDVTLIGMPDENGDPSYESPVAYWMPFVDNLIGLHDANWQATSSFSDPTAYTYVGSHGCVNLETGKAAELFDIIQIGDCVIVHN